MQPDSIIPNAADPQAFNRFSYVRNNPVNFNDPTGHKWTCTGTNDDHCYDDGSEDEISDMAVNKERDQKAGRTPWQKIIYNMEQMEIYGDAYSNGQAAMNYVTASECDKIAGTCYPGSPLFKAMMHKYNTYCDGGNTWSETCVTSFWGYPQGILTGDRRPFSEQKDMAAAILGGEGASYGGFTNDGNRCGGLNADGFAPYCDWANFGKKSTFITTLQATYPSAFTSALVVEMGPSIATYDQGNMYFVVMDYDVYDKYCLKQGICTH